MKKLKFFLVSVLTVFFFSSSFSQFYCPDGVRTIINELEFGVDLNNNQISFDLTCDPCRYDDGGESCKCTQNCYEQGECRDYVDNFYNGNHPHLEIKECCEKKCGINEPPTRTVESSAYAFDFWWTTGLVESANGIPDESFVSPISDNSIREIVHDSTQDFMGKPISYCYRYEVFVEYSDGTCCRFIGAGCFQLG